MMHARKQRLTAWLLLLSIVGCSAALYLPTYRDSFILDDFKQIEFIAPLVESPLEAYQVVNPFWIRWYYRPVEHWAFLLGRLAFGLEPRGYYVGLILLHAANVVLVYVVARKLAASRFGSLCAAALFAVNERHQNVIGWISSVSIATAALGALGCVVCYIVFLGDRRRHGMLVATIALWVFALLSREENLVLPLVLVGIRWLYLRAARPGRREVFAGVFTVLLMSVYLGFQAVRPTWVPNLHGFSAARLFLNLLDQRFSQVFVTVLARWSLLDSASLFESKALILASSAVLLVLLLLWWYRGGRAVKGGLIWSCGYLVFLYLAVWDRDVASVMEDRYLYLPWIGIAIAVGASLAKLADRILSDMRMGRAAVAACLCAFLIAHAIDVRQAQNIWLDVARHYQSAEAQMKNLLPSPSANTHFFAYELPPIADYVQAMAAVWYNRRFSAPGGHVSRLRQLGKATDQYYLFHFHDDTLVNLMPELQEQPGTLFLWNQPPLIERLDAGDQSHPLAPGSFSADRVAGPPQALRLATLVQAPEAGQGWASLAYTVTVPPGSTLRFAALKDAGGLAEEDGMAFRVRIQKPSGELEQVFATFLQPDLPGMASGWREVSVPLEAYWDQTILVRLEVSAGANSSHDLGYWSNPRLVRDTPY